MFEGQIWWVTGASSGIGEALAVELSRRGASPILSGRNVQALEAVKARCGEALVLPFEATDYAAIPAIAERAWAWKGQVHGLINNAGISQRSLALDTDFAVYETMMAVDLMAPIALTQANLPKMAKTGYGRIMAISSVAGVVGAPLRAAYSAAKAGLIAYHDSVRCETAHLGLDVLVVIPGSIRTNVSRNALNADGSTRGHSDTAIEEGMDPVASAARMLDAMAAGQRELILAEGVEDHISHLRRSDPEALFTLMAAMVAKGYAQKMADDKSA
jgi:dehydrogenase/reductase SDR family member 7B